MKRCALPGILAVVACLACLSAFAADQHIAKAFVWPVKCTVCDPGPQNWPIYAHGDVTVVTASGEKVQVTHDASCREVLVSPDHCIVGWLTGPAHAEGEHGETILFTTDLALYRAGAVFRSIHCDGFIHTWRFWNGSKQVAVASGPPRDIRMFTLYDVASGRVVASQERWVDGEEVTPVWATGLEYQARSK